MDAAHFDALARLLSSAKDRRTALRTAVGGTAAVVAIATVGPTDAKKKKRKKKCKGGRQKCRKKCCLVGQSCRNGKCKCARPLLVCPDGSCAAALCGGTCCAVAETCVGTECVPCPEVENSCLVAPPLCANGLGACRTSVDGGNYCAISGISCPAEACTTDDDCPDDGGFPGVCIECESCPLGRACVGVFPE